MDILGMDFKEALTLDGEQLLQACRELALLGNRVDAMKTVLANRIRQQSEEVPLEDSLARKCGSRSTVDLIQWTTGESASKVRARLKLGRQVGYSMSLVGEVLPPPLEHVSRGLAEGHLPVESAEAISNMLTQVPFSADPEDVEYAQRSLVQAATGDDYNTGDEPGVPLHADKIRAICRRWESALDPDGPAPNDEERLRKRFFNLGPVRNGLVSARGLLLAETAAALRTITDALGNPRAEDNSEMFVQADLSDGEDPGTGYAAEAASDSTGQSPTENADNNVAENTGEVDTRTPEQRRHDALAMALDVTLRSRTLPYLGGSHATIMLEVDVRPDSDQTNVGWLRDHEGLATALSEGTVRRISCGAAIQAVATDSMGRIRSLGSTSRIFDANQRRAIALRDQSCVIPGCSIPPAWCEVHHVQPHSRSGPTHTDNGVLLCGFHHRTIDSGGWTITMADGVPKIEPPPWLRRMYPVEDTVWVEPETRPGTPALTPTPIPASAHRSASAPGSASTTKAQHAQVKPTDARPPTAPATTKPNITRTKDVSRKKKGKRKALRHQSPTHGDDPG